MGLPVGSADQILLGQEKKFIQSSEKWSALWKVLPSPRQASPRRYHVAGLFSRNTLLRHLEPRPQPPHSTYVSGEIS